MIALAALLLQAGAAAPLPRDAAFNDPAACYQNQMTSRGIKVQHYLGDRACVKFAPPRRFEGLYVNAFEGQRFVEGARVRAELPRTAAGAVWFSTDDRTEHLATAACPPQHLCRIVFEGRAARDMNRRPLEGYGHFGMSAGLVLADRVLRFEDLGSLGLNSDSRR